MANTAPFINQDDYASVRRAISVNMTTDILPDDVIGDPIYLDRAANDVLRLAPDAPTWTEPEKIAACHRAMILILAARLIPAIPNQASEVFEEYSTTYKNMSPQERISELLAGGQAELAPYIILPGAGVADNLPGLRLGKARPRLPIAGVDVDSPLYGW